MKRFGFLVRLLVVAGVLGAAALDTRAVCGLLDGDDRGAAGDRSCSSILARLNSPFAMAFDTAGSHSVADTRIDWRVEGDLPSPEPRHNRPPVADAGTSNSAQCQSPAGFTYTLDASGSSDPDSLPGTNSDIVLF